MWNPSKLSVNPATGLPKARTALKRAEEAEVSTLVLVWTNVSNCEGLPVNRTPLVYTWDQTLGSIKKDRPCHQPSPAHPLENCGVILKPVLVASLSLFTQHKPRL